MNLQQIKTLLHDNIEDVLGKLNINCEVFGDNIYAPCPIHDHSDNPRAFSYSKQKNIWKCWTRSCQDEFRNDVFGLIRGALSKQNGSEVDFKYALSWIKKQFDIKVKISKNNNPPEIIHNSDFDELVKILQDSITFPESTIAQLDCEIKTPSEYFLKRGFKKETLEHFQVGDCCDKNSKLYDRSIIPIHNDDGSKTIGYIGRAIKEYKSPKFLIYPKGFDKRFYFYNMHRSIEHIKKTNTLFIVEGQGDVWKLYESGIYNAVGMFGKTLSREQEKKLQQLPLTHVIILTDNDQAGREAKIQLQRQLSRFYKLTFPKLSHKDVGEMTTNQIKDTVLSQL